MSVANKLHHNFRAWHPKSLLPVCDGWSTSDDGDDDDDVENVDDDDNVDA